MFADKVRAFIWDVVQRANIVLGSMQRGKLTALLVVAMEGLDSE
jgi:hypothetical protein